MDRTIRERRADDLPALVALLGAQQAASRYPIRWPLPVPVEDFLVRPAGRAAWVAELDGAGVEVGRSRFVRMPGDLPDVILMTLPPYPEPSSRPSTRSSTSK